MVALIDIGNECTLYLALLPATAYYTSFFRDQLRYATLPKRGILTSATRDMAATLRYPIVCNKPFFPDHQGKMVW